MAKSKHNDFIGLDEVFATASTEFVVGENALLDGLSQILKQIPIKPGVGKMISDITEGVRCIRSNCHYDNDAKDYISDDSAHIASDWKSHPELWSHSSRTHASRIVQAVDETNPESTSRFDKIAAGLKRLTPSVFTRNPQLRQVRQAFLLARQQHQQLRKIQKRRLLYAAKNASVKLLLDSLQNELGLIDQIGYVQGKYQLGKCLGIDIDSRQVVKDGLRDQITRIQALKSRDELEGIKGSDLDTRKQCLEQHRAVTKVVADVKKYLKAYEKVTESKSVNESTILQQAEQLELITKRWIDPHFKNPVEQTTMDKIRSGLKISSMSLAAVASITAIILLFTPLAPLSPFVGAAGIVGLEPLFDTAINMLHNAIKYRRGPMRHQSYEMAVAVPLVTTLVVSAHLPAIGQGLANAAAQNNNLPATVARDVSQILTSPAAQAVSQTMGKYGINGFAGGLNSFMVALFARIFKRQSHHANNTKQLKTHKTVSPQSAYRILTVGDKPEQIAKTMWLEPNESESYMLKSPNGKIHKFGSSIEVIRGVGFFRFGHDSAELRQVKEFHQLYCNLASDATLNRRLEILGNIKAKITEWQKSHGLSDKFERKADAGNKKTSRMTPVLKELDAFVDKELKILNEIKDGKIRDAADQEIEIFHESLQDKSASLILVR